MKDIYKQLSPGLTSYLTRMAPESDIEDIIQDVFFKVSQNHEKFRYQSSIKTWVYKIATHTVYDRLRALTPEKQTGKQTDKHLAHDNGDPTGSCVAPPDTKIIQKQMSACVLEVIDTLETPYKEILILKELEQFKNREIATILNISLDNVKIRLHRGRKKLRKALEQACDFYHDSRDIFVCLPKAEPHQDKSI